MAKPSHHDQFVCPKCYGQLEPEDHFLACVACGRRYPVDEHGIPHLLISEGDKYRRVRGQPDEG